MVSVEKPKYEAANCKPIPVAKSNRIEGIFVLRAKRSKTYEKITKELSISNGISTFMSVQMCRITVYKPSLVSHFLSV